MSGNRTQSPTAVCVQVFAFGVEFDHFKSRLESFTMVDWDEVCEELGFSELHKIVCGFSIRDLDAEAQLHPELLDITDACGLSPLHFASRFGRADYVRTLLEHGSNPNIGNERPLVAAAMNDEYQCIRLLLEYGATTDCMREYVWEISDGLYRHAKEEEALAIDALLLEYAYDFNCQDGEGKTALMYCPMFPTLEQSWLHNHRIPKLRLLLDVPVDTEVKDDEGKTALHFAIEHSNVMAFEMLMNAGACLDVDLPEGTTILHYAILHTRDHNLVQAMRKADLIPINLERRDNDGYTALDLLVLRARAEWSDRSCQFDNDFYPRCVQPYRSANSPWIFGWIGVAATLEEECRVVEALEELLQRIQASQGVQEKERYPPLRTLVERDEYNNLLFDSSVSCTDVLPGAWPE